MNYIESLNNVPIMILAIIFVVLSLTIYISYFAKHEWLDNHTNSVLTRTGGSGGSYVTNLQEFTQPAQGPQDFSSMSYQNTWMGDMMRRPLVEHLVDNRCSAYAGDHSYLDQHLNIKNADGSSIYSTMSDAELYGSPMVERDIARAAAESKNKFDRCMKYNTDPNLCAPTVHQYVTDNLRANAYFG